MTEIQRKPEATLKQLALDIVEGKVFHSNMLEDASFLHAVFMPVTYLKKGDIDIENLGLLFEYVDKQGPRSVNGYPTFTSAQMLHKEDMEPLQMLVDKALQMKTDFLGEAEIIDIETEPEVKKPKAKKKKGK